MRSMSVAYLSQASESEAPDCLPPHGAVAMDPVSRANVDKKLKNMFAAFMKGKK